MKDSRYFQPISSTIPIFPGDKEELYKKVQPKQLLTWQRYESGTFWL
jgi:hypothetical protein